MPRTGPGLPKIRESFIVKVVKGKQEVIATVPPVGAKN